MVQIIPTINPKIKAVKLIRTFTINKSTLETLQARLIEAGFERGLKEINFSDLLERLVIQYSDQLQKDNQEDES